MSIKELQKQALEKLKKLNSILIEKSWKEKSESPYKSEFQRSLNSQIILKKMTSSFL